MDCSILIVSMCIGSIWMNRVKRWIIFLDQCHIWWNAELSPNMPQGFKTFFMLNSNEHGFFITLINIKMQTIVGILIFISMINTTSYSLKAGKEYIFSIFMSSWNFILSELGIKKFYFLKNRPRGYKTFHAQLTKSTALKTKIPTNEEVSGFKSLRCCFYHANKC